MINVAIVGFGLSGRYLQSPFFVQNPAFSLKTIVSNTSNPQEVYPFVSVSRSLEEVLRDDSIDLVSVASPNDTHYAYAKAALLAGKHVLVEKPMTATIAQAEELITLAKQRNRVLSVFQNRRFDSDFLTIKKVVEAGFLGDLLSYEAHWHRYKPTLNTKKWKETPSPMSGILYDLGSHLIDQTLHLFGNPKSFWGQTFTQREGSDIDDAFNLYLDYGQLKVTLKSSLLVRADVPRYIIHGTKGSFVKHGIDMQEDHLKAGMMPLDAGFGQESATQTGMLNAEIKDCQFAGNIETEVGNWGLLFQNLADAIKGKADLFIKPEQIVEQLRILNEVKG